MINSEKYYDRLENLQDIVIADREIIPEREPSFSVYLNTRQIDVPKSFTQLAVQGEHNAETIWFTLDRYFDGEDLYDDSKKWGVQFVNAAGEELLTPVTYKSVENTDTTDGNTLKLGWDIPYDITKKAGTVQLGLRCWELNTNKEIIYDLMTEYVSLSIEKGLYITEESENLQNPPADRLTDLVGTIQNLYENNQLKQLNFNDLSNLPQIDGVTLRGGNNNSSANFKNISYNQLLNKPTINVDGKDYIIGEDDIKVSKIEVLQQWNAASEKPVANQAIASALDSSMKTLQDQINTINEELGNMTYIPLKILSFTNNINKCEINTDYIDAVEFNWTVDGTVATQSIAKGDSVITINNPEDRTYTANFGRITDTTDFILTVADKKGNPTNATTSIIFTYKIFYGASPAADTYDIEFLKGLGNSNLQENSATTFTVEGGAEDYVYFAAPASYGLNNLSFIAGGFAGGFGSEPVATIQYNNVDYDIWKSDNKNLHGTIIQVV